MKPKRFKGWRIVGPCEILRDDDRWSYTPGSYDSPEPMFPVSDSTFLYAGKKMGLLQTKARVTVYRRIEK